MEVSIDKEIFGYLELLDNLQKQEVLNVIKSFLSDGFEKEAENEIAYGEEMNKRLEDFEKLGIKGSSLDEVEIRARNSFRLKTNP